MVLALFCPPFPSRLAFLTRSCSPLQAWPTPWATASPVPWTMRLPPPEQPGRLLSLTFPGPSKPVLTKTPTAPHLFFHHQTCCLFFPFVHFIFPAFWWFELPRPFAQTLIFFYWHWSCTSRSACSPPPSLFHLSGPPFRKLFFLDPLFFVLECTCLSRGQFACLLCTFFFSRFPVCPEPKFFWESGGRFPLPLS